MDNNLLNVGKVNVGNSYTTHLGWNSHDVFDVFKLPLTP